MKRYRRLKCAYFINFTNSQEISSKFVVKSRVISDVAATKGRAGVVTNMTGDSHKRKFHVIWNGIDESGSVSSRAIKLSIPVPQFRPQLPLRGAARPQRWSRTESRSKRKIRQKSGAKQKARVEIGESLCRRSPFANLAYNNISKQCGRSW